MALRAQSNTSARGSQANEPWLAAHLRSTSLWRYGVQGQMWSARGPTMATSRDI
jgi:hypothetical protein